MVSRASQLPLALSGETPPAPAKPKRAPKPHHRPKADGPLLPLAQPRFLPVVGVPKTRAECPDTSKSACPHVRCRYHLWRVDAETRAGRPGLNHVPRDARGLVLPVPGAAGNERPGTTLEPRWLVVRGLEIEREVKVYAVATGEGVEFMDVRYGALDLWLARLHPGEPVLVFDDGSCEVVAKAKLTADGRLAMDRALPDHLLNSMAAIVLTRVREMPSSCALDEVEKHGKMGNEAIGDAIGRHRTLVAREVRAALGKAVLRAEDAGIEREDLMFTLMQMGEERNSNGQ